MKTLLAITVVLASAASSMSFAATREVTLTVAGMTCPTCPITVKKALTKVAGVDGVTTDFSNKTVTVSYDDTKARPEQLARATGEAGYPSTIQAAKPHGG
jgi:mercuric transport protein periplasmic component